MMKKNLLLILMCFVCGLVYAVPCKFTHLIFM